MIVVIQITQQIYLNTTNCGSKQQGCEMIIKINMGF